LPLFISSCNNQSAVNLNNNQVANQIVNQNSLTEPAAVNAVLPTNTDTPAVTTPAEVTLAGFAFKPRTLTIKKGTTVTWTNQDLVTHTVTADADSALNFSSPSLSRGDTYQLTFNSLGTFNYHCSPHPQMKAQIIVIE